MCTIVLGDIHGAYKALLQCFERSGFDRIKDRLIVIGDVCDGYPEVRQCIDELLKVKHCDLVIGNHDMWTLDWAIRGDKPKIWTSQGGDRTIASYGGGPMSKAHIDFLKSGQLWIEIKDKIFVHGGFNPDISLSNHNAQTLVWDRTLFDAAWKMQSMGNERKLGSYKDIFVGHTTTEFYNTLKPIHACNVWNIDTGAGWSGKLTIMDVTTKEYWQSDLTQDLYGGTPDKA
ncbi:MAG: metallophosphoesterase, partial [Candidatus Omnitrophica bacterium]|nr:metallophosphoesterase [Candidatus Omnitrophota bacterium]